MLNRILQLDGFQTFCEWPFSITKSISIFTCCLQVYIANLSRPYSIFWMATFQILTKSLFVYELANSACTCMISITKFYTGVTSTCIISFIIIPTSDFWNQTADSEVTFEINSHLSNRSYIYSSCCVTKTVYPWLKGTICPRM